MTDLATLTEGEFWPLIGQARDRILTNDVDALEALIVAGLPPDEMQAAAWALVQRVRGLRADLMRVQRGVQAARVKSSAADRYTGLGREGMVTVWDAEGDYLGCIGSEMWQRLVRRCSECGGDGGVVCPDCGHVDTSERDWLTDARNELRRNERKVEAYDAARATVKIEGNTRAFYILRAEAAEVRLREVLDLIDGVTGPYDDGYVEEVKAIIRNARGG